MDDVTMELTAPDLQILLNLLQEAGKPLRVNYPLYGLDLLEYDAARGRVTSAVSSKAFEEARAKHIPGTAQLQADAPSWSTLRDALLSSGAVTYRNEETVRAYLARQQEDALDARTPSAAVLAFDTNTLYHRVPGRALARLLPHGPQGFRFALSEGVASELGHALKDKYSAEDVATLKRTSADRDIASRLTNRAYGRARRTKAAQAEARILEKGYRAIPTACAPLSAEKEENDRLIAASYATIETRAAVILLTADQAMVHQADAARLRGQLLEIPDLAEVGRGDLDERLLCRLVHDLAVGFGILRLGGTGLLVSGDWSGKAGEGWDQDKVLLAGAPSDLTRALARDLEASRKVEAIAWRLESSELSSHRPTTR